MMIYLQPQYVRVCPCHGLGYAPARSVVYAPTGLGISLNPITWIEEGGSAVVSGVTYVGGKVVEGGKWVAGKVEQGGGYVWDGTKWVWNKLTDPCSYIFGGLSFIPGAKDFVAHKMFQPAMDKLGPANVCTPQGQVIASAALAAYLQANGVPATIGYLGASFGVAEVTSCLCSKGGPKSSENVNPPTPPPTSPPVSHIVTPIAVGAGALLLAKLIF